MRGQRLPKLGPAAGTRRVGDDRVEQPAEFGRDRTAADALRNPLQQGEPQALGVPPVAAGDLDDDHAMPLVRQVQLGHRLARVGPALEYRPQQFGRRAALRVGVCAPPEQVQRDDGGSVGEGGRALVGHRPGHDRPHRTEEFAAHPDRHDQPRERAVALSGHEDRLAAARKLAEDAARPEPGEDVVGDAAAHDRRDARGVGEVLAGGIGEHAGVRVLDGDRSVDDGGDRVRRKRSPEPGSPPFSRFSDSSASASSTVRSSQTSCAHDVAACTWMSAIPADLAARFTTGLAACGGFRRTAAAPCSAEVRTSSAAS